MDQLQEANFMDNEKAYLAKYGEEENMKAYQVFDEAHATDNVEQKVEQAFVYEKNSILNNVYDLLMVAAKPKDIPLDKIFTGEAQMKRATELKSKILTPEDSWNIKNRVSFCLMKYQEYSSVLDSMLQDILEPIMKFMQHYIRKSCAAGEHVVPSDTIALFEILYNICNVRGYKTVVKFFPHEAADMEPCVEMLHFQEPDINQHVVPCMLVLWLSIIVLVPFDLNTIDSKKAGDSYEILVKRIINICRENFNSAGKLRDYSAVLLSKLLTRPDVIKQGVTDDFLKEIAKTYVDGKEEQKNIIKITGILQTLVEVFKIGHREDFLSRINIVFADIVQSEVKNKFMAKSSIIRKSKVKLAQRIGCIFLKPKVAAWRYQRGSRTLSHLMDQNKQAQKEEEEDEEMLDEDEIDFEQLEFIMQILLESLKDEENVVRWSAAKGLGRITQRLTKDFADQIVEQLYDLFSDTETENSWHGGCLALAELCRRGLLLPERLEMFVPILDKALLYDVNKGNHSVGAHVRDAACYVVWSFSRAYSPEIMKPHVHTLSTKLMLVSLFDREVNCRRAASATFQECVGRQGNFPHGIDILTEADYFTLSNRVNAYLNVSCFVGQFPEYFESMVKHLAFTKLNHWEPAIRILASQALSVLSIFNPELMVKEILLPLIDKCFSKALHVRHGAIYGVGEILIGLSGNSIINRKEVLEKSFKTLSLKERNILADSENQSVFKNKYLELSKKSYLDQVMGEGSDALTKVRTIISKVESENLYKGKGGEIMRAGVCHLIHAISISKIPLGDQLSEELISQLVANFKHPNFEIQDEATKSFESFCRAYFGPDVEVNNESVVIKHITKLFEPSKNDPNISATRGFNMSFGVLSPKILQFLNPQVLEVLNENCVPKGKESDDAESRRQSIKSLIHVMESLGLENISKELRQRCLETFYKGYDDYAIDRRGDVGSWVRQEAMTSLHKYIHLLVTCKDPQVLIDIGGDNSQFFERFVAENLQQLNEKIDRVRESAGRSLQNFFKFTVPLIQVEFSRKEELVALFISEETDGAQVDTIISSDGIAYLPWRNAQFVFNSIKHLFDSDAYSMHILKGLITSSGGLTESTMKASQHSLFEYLSGMQKDKTGGIQQKKNFIAKLCKIMQNCHKQDRVTVPLMKTIEMLLSADYLSDEEIQEDLLEIHRLTVAECSKSKNIVKLMESVGVFAGMLNSSNSELCKKAIRTLLFLLYHGFPKVRKLAAEKLYTGLLTMEEYESIIPGGEDAYEEVNELISETDWSLEAKVLKAETQEKMYAYFGFELKK